MNICLKDLEGVEVYVDDIVIFSDTWEEHLKRLEKVLFLALLQIEHDLEGVEVYVDGIVIFSDTWEEHLKRLEKVLFWLFFK